MLFRSYTLAVDRGNQEVQGLYNESDLSILYQIEYVLKICKEYGVETSICGQAGSQKEMVKFLVEKGIDSISVNADVAADIANYVAELEGRTAEQKEERKQPEEAFVKPRYIEPEEAGEEVSEETYKEPTPKPDEEEFPMMKGAEPVQEEPELEKEEPPPETQPKLEPEPIEEKEEPEPEVQEQPAFESKPDKIQSETEVKEGEPNEEKEEKQDEPDEEVLDVF